MKICMFETCKKSVETSLFCPFPRAHTFFRSFQRTLSLGPSFCVGLWLVGSRGRGQSPHSILLLACLKLELRAKKRITVRFTPYTFLTLDTSGSGDFSSNRCTMCFTSKNPNVGRYLTIMYSNHFFCR